MIQGGDFEMNSGGGGYAAKGTGTVTGKLKMTPKGARKISGHYQASTLMVYATMEAP